jgi:TolB-like protein
MQTKLLTFLFTMTSLIFFTACSNTQITAKRGFPAIASSQKIALYGLDNYTDTPRAGLRAANITEGLLLARGYRVSNSITTATRKMSLSEKIADARRHHARYLITGGVSEWRYKTGIDGEPAVSVQLKLIDTHSRRVVWSATGSDSSWGNTSIGVVAQNLISGMLPATSR